MLRGGGAEILKANSRWIGPGGESAPLSPEGDLMVVHAYDAVTGKTALQISTIEWTGKRLQVALGCETDTPGNRSGEPGELIMSRFSSSPPSLYCRETVLIPLLNESSKVANAPGIYQILRSLKYNGGQPGMGKRTWVLYNEAHRFPHV